MCLFSPGAPSGDRSIGGGVAAAGSPRYQQSIQIAFREVEDALIDQKRSREELEIQTRQVESLSTYARFARLRFDNGYTSYIEVLDAERSLFTRNSPGRKRKEFSPGAGEPLQGDRRRLGYRGGQ